MEKETRERLEDFLQEKKIIDFSGISDIDELVALKKRFPSRREEIEKIMFDIINKGPYLVMNSKAIRAVFIIIENTSPESDVRGILKRKLTIGLRTIISLFQLLWLFDDDSVNSMSIGGELLKSRTLEVIAGITKYTVKDLLLPVIGQDIETIPEFALEPIKQKIKELLG